jgi:pimeloyl-ACP methyl ester carboxylesterase
MSLQKQHSSIISNGVKLHLVSQGEGPLVLLCHGFPGLWYSWRKQLPVLAAAGFQAVAFDQRGFGRSDRPMNSDAYDSDTLVGDVLAILDALGEEKAVVVGQDFGALLTWNVAARAPDRVRAAIVMGVPYDFESAPGEADDEAELLGDVGLAPSEQYAQVARDHFYHMHYFQTIGPADQELGARPRDFLERLYWALGAQGSLLDWRNFPSQGTGYLDVLPAPARPLPWGWLTVADMDYLVQEYTRAGPSATFIGGLNNYRVADRNWKIRQQTPGLSIKAPVLYLMGEKDPVRDMLPAAAFEHMRQLVPGLVGEHWVPGAGHFVMQEAADEVNALMLEFLRQLA